MTAEEICDAVVLEKIPVMSQPFQRRHGRACPGHPRLAALRHGKKDVDARDERGHDAGVIQFDRKPR
jgi:hypothetical protein